MLKLAGSVFALLFCFSDQGYQYVRDNVSRERSYSFDLDFS